MQQLQSVHLKTWSVTCIGYVPSAWSLLLPGASDSWRPPWRWTFRRSLYHMANLGVSCNLSKSISSHCSSNISNPVCFDLLLAAVNVLKIFTHLCQQMRSLNTLWGLFLGCPCVKGTQALQSMFRQRVAGCKSFNELVG